MAALVGATRTGMIVASGAMPVAPAAALECSATIPAIAVPEPRQSVLPRPVPPIMSSPTVTRPASSGKLASTPESTIATITPAPRLYGPPCCGATPSIAHWPCEFPLLPDVPAHGPAACGARPAPGAFLAGVAGARAVTGPVGTP